MKPSSNNNRQGTNCKKSSMYNSSINSQANGKCNLGRKLLMIDDTLQYTRNCHLLPLNTLLNHTEYNGICLNSYSQCIRHQHTIYSIQLKEEHFQDLVWLLDIQMQCSTNLSFYHKNYNFPHIRRHHSPNKILLL